MSRKNGPPEDPTPKQWNNYFWKELNEYCLSCSKSCKQSAKVTLVYCPDKPNIIPKTPSPTETL